MLNPLACNICISMNTKNQILFIIAISALIFFPASCSKKSSNGKASSFEAESLHGKTYEFTSLETGKVIILQGGLERLDQIDDTGNPRYFTSDVVADFTSTDKIPASDKTGFAVRFNVPRIADNDYLIIKADIKLPAKADFGGGPTESIQANFRYDEKNSGRTEYIWFLFDKNNPALQLPGKWIISLYNNDTNLISAVFSVEKHL